MDEKTKYFTLPGYGNSSPDHWQSYFEAQLKNCKRINQRSWTEPKREDWVHQIDLALSNIDLAHVVIITHSLGGIALLHWAKKYQKKIKGALIVAPPDLENPHEDLLLDSFVPIPMNQLMFPSTLVCSSNDHWASVERSAEFALAWGSTLVTLENAGHINDDSGYGQWGEGLEILDKLAQRTPTN